MRGDFVEAVRVREGLQTQDLVAQFEVSGHVDRAEGLEEALVAQALGDEVEGAVQHATGGVQSAVHLHGRLELLGAGDVQVAHVAHEARDLPAGRGVAREEGVVDAELGGQAQAGELRAAVHDLLRADARVAIHVFVVAHREVARQVRDALLERVEVADVRLLTAQGFHDVIEDLGVDVLHEEGVEGAQLVDRIELVDDAVRVAADHHVEGLDVVQVDGLPQLRHGLGQGVDALEDLAECRGEVAVEVDVTEHDPRIASAHGRARDAVARAHLDAPLVGGALDVVRRVVGLVDVGLEGVGREVVVRGAHVGVVQAFPHAPQGAVVVARGVLAVDDDVDAVLVGQVEEVFLLVADDQRDIRDADLVELADLALDQDLAAHLERALGALVADRCESGGQAGGHDDGSRDAVGLEGVAARLGDGAVPDVAGGLALAGGGVDAAQAHAGRLGEGALGQGGVRRSQAGEDVELGFAQGANVCRRHATTFRSLVQLGATCSSVAPVARKVNMRGGRI